MKSPELIEEPVVVVVSETSVVGAAEGIPYQDLPVEKLASLIADFHKQAMDLVIVVNESARSSLEKALSAGRALLAAKEKVPHGSWNSWRAQIPGLSKDQACRYMKMAREISHVRNLNEIRTVRQAYLATGVIKKPSVKTKEPNVKAKDGANSNDVRKAAGSSDIQKELAVIGSYFVSLREFCEKIKPQLVCRKMEVSTATVLMDEVRIIHEWFTEIKEELTKMIADQ